MKIKDRPEDFIVEEVPIDFSGNGNYAIYRLTKKNYNTESAVETICKRFNVQRKNIKYAGTKDRNAFTIQYISIFKDRGALKLDNEDLKIEFVAFHDEPLSLGSLKSNRFIITVRDVKNVNADVPEFVPNYYDEQRFSKNNFEIGLSILRKEFNKAVSLIDDEQVKAFLAKNPNDCVGALHKIPKKILSIYIHAVQSYIFNESLHRKIAELHNITSDIEGFELDYSLGKFFFTKYHDDSELPLVGFDTSTDGTDAIHIKNIMEELKLSPKDFIIRSIPELSVEQSFRKSFMKLEDFSAAWINYPAESGTDSCIVRFTLSKGSYATIALKALFAGPK